MPNYRLQVNGRQQTVDVQADMPLLWVLRDTPNMKGTKFGCGVGPRRRASNQQKPDAPPANPGVVSNQAITTIEGLSTDGLILAEGLGRSRCTAVRYAGGSIDDGSSSVGQAETHR